MATKTKKTMKNEMPTIKKRPPVAVVLGHVDHGKSSLLEAIRDFKITVKESGGITQHIGAYEVEHNGRKITFIDTPGHEAFSAMRLRGAAVADIALLVVDASQTVQPQTKEAIEVIKKANLPVIAVINKIDLPTADPKGIERGLAGADIFVESMGGTVPSVNVSAKEKTGIDELLEVILLVSDLHNLEADEKSPPEGLIIESHMDALKGPVATVIVEKGILQKKFAIATDSAAAKIKSLENFRGEPIDRAYPSQPAIVLGFENVPGIGERFKSYNSFEEAVLHAEKGKLRKRTGGQVIEGGLDVKYFSIVLKGDCFGSLEAIGEMLKNLPQDKVFLRILKIEVGDINESDVKLAEMSGAQIAGFGVKVSPTASAALKKDVEKKVRVKLFNIIYELIQDTRSSMEKSLEPEVVRQESGKLKTIAVFWGEKNRQIVGGKITDGELKKGLKLEVWRGDEKIGAGRIINLQRDRKDAERLTKGSEAGILFEGNIRVEEGDILVAFTEERRKGEL